MSTRTLTRSGLLLALAVIIPQIFHLVGGPGLGSVILPMHFPVYLAGFLIGPVSGFFVGILAPVISHLITGMPPLAPVPVLFLMMVELPLMGILTGYFYRQRKWNALPSLLMGMVGGRVGMGLFAPLLFHVVGFPESPLVYMGGSIVTGLPGIILQLVLLPLLLKTRFLQEVEDEQLPG